MVFESQATLFLFFLIPRIDFMGLLFQALFLRTVHYYFTQSFTKAVLIHNNVGFISRLGKCVPFPLLCAGLSDSNAFDEKALCLEMGKQPQDFRSHLELVGIILRKGFRQKKH